MNMSIKYLKNNIYNDNKYRSVPLAHVSSMDVWKVYMRFGLCLDKTGFARVKLYSVHFWGPTYFKIPYPKVNIIKNILKNVKRIERVIQHNCRPNHCVRFNYS